jgi:hypothetical protein
MDKYERRRQKLIELRDSRCGGKVVCVAKRIGREPSYVSRMMYPDGKAGKKRIGDDIMDVIETAFGLPRGWIDGLSTQPDQKIEEWEKIVWLWEHADDEVRLMLSLLTGAMYERKRKELEQRIGKENNEVGLPESGTELPDTRGNQPTHKV